MARTLAERLQAEARESFVGREAELDVLREALAAEVPPFAVAFVHGPGGVGKSRLLRALADQTPPEVSTVWLDCSRVEPTARGFLRALATELDEDSPDPEPGWLAALMCVGGRKSLLVLDTYETFGLLDGWLRNEFLPLLPETALAAIAGRGAPSPAWRTTPGWTDLICEIELSGLAPKDARMMLARRGLDEGQAEKVLGFAHGHPLALELAAAALRARPDLQITHGPPPQVLGQLSAAFLSGLDSGLAEAAEAACSVRRVTRPTLEALLNRQIEDRTIERLLDLPFTEATVEGLAFQDLFRDTVAADLARRDPDRQNAYRRRAWRFLTNGAQAAEALNLWQHTADLLFLFQNPYVREAFFPAGATEVSMEAAGPEARSEVMEIVAGTTPAERELMASWWEHRRNAFYVARDGEGRVAGFYLLADARDLHPAVRAADPVIDRWYEHLDRNPLDKRERALFFRRWLTREVGEGPSPVQAACWLDVKRTYMELRPDLRRLYAAMNDVTTYAPTLAPLGFAPLQEADVEIGDSPLQSAILDFGEESVEGWLRGLIASELGVDPQDLRPGAGEDVLPEGTVTIMFSDIADSTGLTERLGDHAFRALARELDRTVRLVIGEAGGVPVEGVLVGDGLMAVFTSAHQAIEASLQVRSAASDIGLELHVGLHAGDVIREDGNVFGGAVNLAARVASAAPPGEVFASETVKGLARTSVGVSFASCGAHELKGVEGRHELYAIRG